MIEAPIDRVFDAITDHGAYHRLPGISTSRLLVEGKEDKNGLGAVRELKAGALTFEEEIVGFKRPELMEYKIRRATLPIEHELGRIVFKESGSGTEVVWTSTFALSVPVVGRLLGPLLNSRLKRSFDDMLGSFKAQLTR